MKDFELIMAHEQGRIEQLKVGIVRLQEQIESTEAYMRSCVERHVIDTRDGVVSP